MNSYYSISRELWEEALVKLGTSFSVYASVKKEDGQDYELIDSDNVTTIIYNIPKPVTPLKSFFIPVRENVTKEADNFKPRLIIGAPNCDIAALDILDEIYLDKSFDDIFYRQKRENTILISSDCFETEDNCHCVSYDIKPYSEKESDLSLVRKNDLVILRVNTQKGVSFIGDLEKASPVTDKSIISFIENKHRETADLLKRANKGLPDYKTTGQLIKRADALFWKEQSAKCVSCGACSAICPTCSCFLLIDKPGFHKVKQMDACQYPGFERVAGGEDALDELHNRFSNRYMCKFVWKPIKFSGRACTGCGRCIDACIGKISKNEIIMELAK